MTLSAYGYASSHQVVGFARPRASANRVSYAHGALTEWYANGPLGIEQGFDVATRPGAGTGTLTLSLALSGDLAAGLRDGSVLLTGRGVALRYGGLVATDERGRVLHSWLGVAKGHVLIHIADRGATYPLRIDPLMQQGEKLTGAGKRKRPIRLQRGAVSRWRHGADRRARPHAERKSSRGGVAVYALGVHLDPAGRKAHRRRPRRRNLVRPHRRRRIRLQRRALRRRRHGTYRRAPRQLLRRRGVGVHTLGVRLDRAGRKARRRLHRQLRQRGQRRDRKRRIRQERRALRRRRHGADRRAGRQRRRRRGVGIHPLGSAWTSRAKSSSALHRQLRQRGQRRDRKRRIRRTAWRSPPTATRADRRAATTAAPARRGCSLRSGTTWAQQGPKLTGDGRERQKANSATALRCPKTATRR